MVNIKKSLKYYFNVIKQIFVGLKLILMGSILKSADLTTIQRIVQRCIV